MKKLFETFMNFIPFLELYPLWLRLLVAVWVFLSAVIFIALIFAKRVDIPLRTSNQAQPPKGANATEPSQQATVKDSQNSNIYQSGRDIIIGEPGRTKKESSQILIRSITVEVRLTCELKKNAEIPPGEVDFLSLGDAHAYLEGSAGRVRLIFQSPVRFRLIDGDRVVVINRFSLEGGSDILNRSRQVLRNYNLLSIPIVTVVWGKSLEKIRLLEVFLSINNDDPIYESYSYDTPFQEGPRFAVQLEPFSHRLLPKDESTLR